MKWNKMLQQVWESFLLLDILCCQQRVGSRVWEKEGRGSSAIIGVWPPTITSTACLEVIVIYVKWKHKYEDQQTWMTKNDNETPKEEVFKSCLSSEIIRGKGTFWYYLSRQDCIRSCLRNNKVKEKYRTKIDKSTENLNVCERRNLVLTNIHKLKAIHSIQ